MIPTLGPKVCKCYLHWALKSVNNTYMGPKVCQYYLHWALWILRDTYMCTRCERSRRAPLSLSEAERAFTKAPRATCESAPVRSRLHGRLPPRRLSDEITALNSCRLMWRSRRIRRRHLVSSFCSIVRR